MPKTQLKMMKSPQIKETVKNFTQDLFVKHDYSVFTTVHDSCNIRLSYQANTQYNKSRITQQTS